MHLEEERNNRHSFYMVIAITPTFIAQKLVYPLLHERMDARFKRSTLLGICENLGGDVTALCGVGHELVNNVVGVDSLDAEFIQVSRDKRLAAGDSSG